MAFQTGLFPVRGKLGNIVFYKTEDGMLAKMNGSLDKKRVKEDAAFERSRKASEAFTHVGKSAGLIRRAMGGRAMKLGERRIIGQLGKRIWELLRTDPEGWMDKKRIYNGNMNLLKGMPWNRERRLDRSLLVDYTVSMDRANGLYEVRMDSFAPLSGLAVPDGASHFELLASAAGLDFDNEAYDGGYASSSVLPIDGNGTGNIALSCQIGGGSSLPVVMGLGIVFYQEVGGTMNLLQGGGAFEIVGVEG